MLNRSAFLIAIVIAVLGCPLYAWADDNTALVSWLEQVPDDGIIEEFEPGFTDGEVFEVPEETIAEGTHSGPWVYPNKFQLAGIYPLDPVALDQNGTPPYCRSCSRPGCGPLGCGPCGGGCVQPTWFASSDFVLLNRNSAKRLNLSGTQTVVVVNNNPQIRSTVLMSTRDLDFGFEPGARITFGRFLGTDFLKRVHSIEFSYLGFFDFHSSEQRNGANQTQTFNGLPVATAGSLISFFPTTTAGFTFANLHQAEYSSNLSSYEVNYRLRSPLGRDSLVAKPNGSWFRRCTPGMTPSFIFGTRYLSISEAFNFFSSGTRILFNQFGQPVQTGTATGNYNIRSTNDLFGFQIGGDVLQQYCNFNIGFHGKTGVYSNWVSQTSVITASDILPNLNNPSRAIGATSQHAAFVGEIGIVGNYHVRQNLNLRAAYDFMWVTGLALAPLQIQRDLQSPARVENVGYTLFQGVNVGAELFW